MKYKLNYSKEAKRDIISIKEYIIYKLKNPNASIRTLEKIFETTESLIEFPERGGRLFEHMPVDYRFVLANNYIVIYRITATNVYISRVLYKRRDFLKIILERKIYGL